MKWRWYISIAAVRQYMAIAGLGGPLETTNPDFVAAQESLGGYSLTARRVGERLYRTGRVHFGQRVTRLEFVLADGTGPLPSLVAVVAKGASRGTGRGTKGGQSRGNH